MYGVVFLKKFFLFIISVFFLTSCDQTNNFIVTFEADADVYISDIQFHAEMTQDYITFSSSNLTESLAFYNGMLFSCGIAVPFLPKENSAINLNFLICDVMEKNAEFGTFNGIDYICEFTKDRKKINKIVWGNVVAVINNWE